MGTKNNPGSFDCYANAEPDEPMFVLLARDAYAPLLIRTWAADREVEGEDPAKVAEARACADACEKWRKKKEANQPPVHVTLMDRALAGEFVACTTAGLEQLFSDEIATWHSSPLDGRDLHNFLGLTNGEYSDWVQTTRTFENIVLRRLLAATVGVAASQPERAAAQRACPVCGNRMQACSVCLRCHGKSIKT